MAPAFENSTTIKIKWKSYIRILAQPHKLLTFVSLSDNQNEIIKKPCNFMFTQNTSQYIDIFLTQLKTVHLQGIYSSRLCISRPYSQSEYSESVIFFKKSEPMVAIHKLTLKYGRQLSSTSVAWHQGVAGQKSKKLMRA